MKPFWLFGAVLVGACFLAREVQAQVDTVVASYKYIMGDNDSKSDARNLCFLNAKKLCLEKAGTFVQSQLSLKKREVQGGKSEYTEVTEQDIKTFTGAFLKVDVLGEDLSYAGETIAISMTVRALVNSRAILEQILAVKEDQSLAKRLKEQQDQLSAMEAKIGQLQTQLKNATPDLTKPARVERVEVFAKMSELEAIKYDIARKTKMAVDYVELGMTPEEVKRVMGEPRSVSGTRGGDFGYSYGRVWVLFEGGVVTALIRSEYFKANPVMGRNWHIITHGTISIIK